MIRLDIGLEIRRRGVRDYIEDKTVVVVVAASCRNASRNPVRFKALTSRKVKKRYSLHNTSSSSLTFLASFMIFT